MLDIDSQTGEKNLQNYCQETNRLKKILQNSIILKGLMKTYTVKKTDKT